LREVLTLPSRTRELRLYLGMDQAEMAEWLDTKQSVVSLWESGKRTPPYREIALRFGVSIDWLQGLAYRRWGERVLTLTRELRQHLASLPEPRRATLSAGPPNERVRYVFESLHAAAPDLVSRNYYACLSGLTPAALELVFTDDAGITEVALQRLSDYTGIPERWFAAGDFAILEEPDLSEYYPLVHQMRLEGITPEDIRRIWSAIRSIR
jgi:transcriptional regulator with XRE-family HTH domain